MEEAILVAIIACIGSIGGQWLVARKDRLEADAKQDVRSAVLEQRLEGIERRLDEHNSYAKRFEEVAVSLAELRTELKMKG